MFFIDAKVNASNETTPSSNSPKVEERYTKGGNNWYSQVLNSSFPEIVVRAKKYELLRFWLLGSWIAHNLGVNFFLVNLVPEQREQNIIASFGKYAILENNPNQRRAFLRLTWEQICEHIALSKERSPEKETVLHYLENKSAGYDRNGILQKAFTIG